MAGCTRRPSARSVHPALEVKPAVFRHHDAGLGDRGGVLAQHVQQDDEVARSPVEDPVELRAIVTTQLAQLTTDLARVRERRRRCRGRPIV